MFCYDLYAFIRIRNGIMGCESVCLIIVILRSCLSMLIQVFQFVIATRMIVI